MSNADADANTDAVKRRKVFRLADAPHYERDKKRKSRERQKAKRAMFLQTIRSAPGQIDTKGMPETALSKFTSSLLNTAIKGWDSAIREHVVVHTTISFCSEDMIMREKQKTGSVKITGKKEMERTYKLLFLGEPILEVKKSLIPNSGYGLFVAKNGGFMAHEVVGMYFGAILKPNVHASH